MTKSHTNIFHIFILKFNTLSILFLQFPQPIYKKKEKLKKKKKGHSFLAQAVNFSALSYNIYVYKHNQIHSNILISVLKMLGWKKANHTLKKKKKKKKSKKRKASQWNSWRETLRDQPSRCSTKSVADINKAHIYSCGLWQ